MTGPLYRDSQMLFLVSAPTFEVLPRPLIAWNFCFLFLELKDFKTCNTGAKPLNALVTSRETPDTMVTKWQNMLKNANLTDLKKGGIVSSNAEKLEKYMGSVEDYVGDYGKYFNALFGPDKPNPTTTSSPTNTPSPTNKPSTTNSATSSFVSFALQTVAILAFVILI